MKLDPIRAINNRKISGTYKQILNDLERKYVTSLNAQPLYKDIAERVSMSIKVYGDDWRLSYYEQQDHSIPVIYAINATALQMISSGRYHTYRGILNLDGELLKEIFFHSLKDLEYKKYYTRKEVKEITGILNDNIASVG